MYNFLHGYDTLVPGSWLPSAGTDGILGCEDALCGGFLRGGWAHMFKEGATAAQLLDMECGICKVERMRRNRLLGHGSNAHLQPEFAELPYIHPFHAPKTFVSLLRAVHFAQSKNQQLLWCTSVDVSLSQGMMRRGQPTASVHHVDAG